MQAQQIPMNGSSSAEARGAARRRGSTSAGQAPLGQHRESAFLAAPLRRHLHSTVTPNDRANRHWQSAGRRRCPAGTLRSAGTGNRLPLLCLEGASADSCIP